MLYLRGGDVCPGCSYGLYRCASSVSQAVAFGFCKAVFGQTMGYTGGVCCSATCLPLWKVFDGASPSGWQPGNTQQVQPLALHPRCPHQSLRHRKAGDAAHLRNTVRGTRYLSHAVLYLLPQQPHLDQLSGCISAWFLLLPFLTRFVAET